MVDQEQPAEPGPAAPGERPAAAQHDVPHGAPFPQTQPGTPFAQPPPAQQSAWPGRRHRLWTVVTHRAAGWVVATALAGAVIALSVVLATGPAPAPVAFRVGGPLAASVPAGAGPVTLTPRQVIMGAQRQVILRPPGQFAAGPGPFAYGPGPFVYGPGPFVYGPGPFVHGPWQVFAGPGGGYTVAPALRPGKVAQVIRGCAVTRQQPGVRIYCRVVPKSPAGK